MHAYDPLQAAAFYLSDVEDKYFFRLRVFLPSGNAFGGGYGGEWLYLCATRRDVLVTESRRDEPYFAVCNKTDSQLYSRPAQFRKVCYSHWRGIPENSECDVFGIQYTPNRKFLMKVLGVISAYEEGLRWLGVNDYHKAYMLVDSERSDNADRQRFVFFRISTHILYQIFFTLKEDYIKR